ncbi:MAG: hypothetical protein IPM29_23945 [Planctomycetes bacterium]|nr:hypothetical protein [Planctomycetota bacterium]
MLRQFLFLTVCTALCAWLGDELAGSYGAIFGGVFGIVFVLIRWSVVSGARRPAAGAPLQHADERVLCVPNGRMADVRLVHDGRHWCDVEACSVCTPAEKVECHKRCLDLLNDTAPPRELTKV